MKKGKPLAKEHLKKRHHRVKLATLFSTKLVCALLAFALGLYLGTFVGNMFVAILIATCLAALVYLVAVLHVIDYLKL